MVGKIHAFPGKEQHVIRTYGLPDRSVEVYYDGMELRDYFAAKAMHSMIIKTEGTDGNWVSKAAYKIADAMMETRKPKPEEKK